MAATSNPAGSRRGGYSGTVNTANGRGPTVEVRNGVTYYTQGETDYNEMHGMNGLLELIRMHRREIEQRSQTINNRTSSDPNR